MVQSCRGLCFCVLLFSGVSVFPGCLCLADSTHAHLIPPVSSSGVLCFISVPL